MSEIWTKASYAAARGRLLERIAAGLKDHPAVCAAWLAGSLGRGDGDELSDIDLCLVVEEASSGQMCQRDPFVASGAPSARRKLFEMFGDPVNIHENHNNAPEGGSFSSVLYRDPPVIVDWAIFPVSIAVRPADTRLLFSRVPVPDGALPPGNHDFSGADLTPDQRTAERLAFFWMMAMVAAKYTLRGDVEKMVWVQRFMADQFTGLLNTGTAELLGLDLQTLCRRVTAQYPTSAAPLEMVEILLRLK